MATKIDLERVSLERQVAELQIRMAALEIMNIPDTLTAHAGRIDDIEQRLRGIERKSDMRHRLRLHEISELHSMLNGAYCDPYVEVGTVNEVLKILGYKGHFEYNENTNKVSWRAE